ncbi:MAG: hypothetical protein FGM24_01710 [Candidatus Kapabacteria bacterium]|nr:hypothetical protein [Candidatus Kapabacteria bacterium]
MHRCVDGIRPYLARLTVVLVAIVATCAVHAQPLAETLPSVRIAVVGDMQRTGTIEFWRERNVDASERILAHVAAEQPAALFLLGDMVWWGSSDVEWDRFDSVMRPVSAANIPVHPILGNHEYLGDTARGMRNVRMRFPEMRHDADVHVIDSIAFVLINTNVSAMTDSADRRLRQWFAYTLRRLDADPSVLFVVVCGHHPPFTNSRITRPNKKVQDRYLWHVQHAAKTAFWFAGHAHSYERFEVDGKQYIVAGGGGAPRQNVRLAREGARFVDQYDGPARRPLHYLMLERHGRELTCTMHPLRSAVADYAPDTATVSAASRADRQSTDAIANSAASMRETIFPLLITPGSPAPGCVPAPVK